jgi:hypothetical protein
MEKGHNETSGWLAYLLKKHKVLEERNAAMWARVMSDYQCQLVAIETMEATAGPDYVDPRLVSEHSVAHAKSNGRFHCSHKPGVPKGIFTIPPYLLHAYNVTRSSFRRRMKDLKQGQICKPESATHTHHLGTSINQ